MIFNLTWKVWESTFYVKIKVFHIGLFCTIQFSYRKSQIDKKPWKVSLKGTAKLVAAAFCRRDGFKFDPIEIEPRLDKPGKYRLLGRQWTQP